jgi:hypothetical protein
MGDCVGEIWSILYCGVFCQIWLRTERTHTHLKIVEIIFKNSRTSYMMPVYILVKNYNTQTNNLIVQFYSIFFNNIIHDFHLYFLIFYWGPKLQLDNERLKLVLVHVYIVLQLNFIHKTATTSFLSELSSTV